jgi:prepilin-type N-terminal cleavage/methylation domain-containing protein
MNCRPFSLTRRHGRRAFSLIEVVIALAAAAIGLVAFMAVVSHAIRSGRTAADEHLSATIIQDLFNDIRAQNFSNVTLAGFDPPGPYDLAVESGTISNSYSASGFETNATALPYFKISITFTNPLPAMSRVHAAVVWDAKSPSPANTNWFVTSMFKPD